jgi:hypothetical protein
MPPCKHYKPGYHYARPGSHRAKPLYFCHGSADVFTRARSPIAYGSAPCCKGWTIVSIRTHCATRSPLMYCNRAVTCARCKKCSDTPASAAHKSTLTWIFSTWQKSTTRRIHAQERKIPNKKRKNPAFSTWNPTSYDYALDCFGISCLAKTGVEWSCATPQSPSWRSA